MTRMRAVVIDDSAPSRLALGEVERPDPKANEALVKVAAISLNRGEVRGAGSAPEGAVIGWDLAGTIEVQASDGSGPAHGTRVVGLLGTGAWAEYAAVPANAMATIPDSVSFAAASTLPVAGLTALRTLEHGGLLLEKRVLITGASGGVGVFALQLARRGGAYVVGAVRQPRSEGVARELGANDVVVGDDLSHARSYGPYDLILESVGGETLAQALTLLARDGRCISFGMSGGSEATINVRALYATGGLSLYGFILFYEHTKNPVANDLGRLVQLVAEGKLQVPIALEAPWSEVGAVAGKLTARQFTGKAVLHVE
jgi:NADPH2:quinone reductase